VNPSAHLISGQTTHLSPYALSAVGTSVPNDARAEATPNEAGVSAETDASLSQGDGSGAADAGGSPPASEDGNVQTDTDARANTLPLETLNVTLATSGVDASVPTYSFSCPGYTGSAMGGGTGAGDGPEIQTPNAMNNSPCWPAANPNIDLFVGFSGFLPANGPPVGSFDLSTISGSPCVWLQVQSTEAVPVGMNAPFRNYSSASGCGPGYVGSGALGASGTLTLTAMGAYDAGASSNGGPSAGLGPTQVYLLQLTNVMLPSSQDESNGLYPSEAVVSATGYWAYTPM
jgi:hypothetical protein